MKLPFFVVVTSPTSTRPLPRNEITSPLLHSVLGLAPSLQFTFTAPAAIKSLILLLDMRKPADATASSRMLFSTLAKVSTLGGGTLRSVSGAIVAETLTQQLGTDVPLLGQIPFDVALREGGDSGQPLVLSTPDAPAAQALEAIAQRLGNRPRGLAGMSLGITPAARA